MGTPISPAIAKTVALEILKEEVHNEVTEGVVAVVGPQAPRAVEIVVGVEVDPHHNMMLRLAFCKNVSIR